jgi:4'-phosphopantetheinyl transferase
MMGEGRAGLASAGAGAAPSLVSPSAAKPVTWWPGALAPSADGVHVIGMRGSGEREAARTQVRVALREAIGQLYGFSSADIMIQFSPGVPPSLSFPRSPSTRPPGISISHDGPISLAAINLHGPVGIDLMQVQDIDDWRALARDYLGAGTLSELQAAAAAQRAGVLARAWTEHEARLKCHGRQLAEWTGAPLPALCRSLELPAPFVGTVATLPE